MMSVCAHRFHTVESLEVAKTATEKLRSSGYAELRQIVCEYEQGSRALTLGGHVSFFYCKQTAQELVRRVEHVERVINLIDVRKR